MKRHRLDSTSLVAGVLFALVAGAYLLAQHSHRAVDARWVLPLVLVGLGVAGLAGAVQSLTAGRTREPAPLPAGALGDAATAADDSATGDSLPADAALIDAGAADAGPSDAAPTEPADGRD